MMKKKVLTKDVTAGISIDISRKDKSRFFEEYFGCLMYFKY